MTTVGTTSYGKGTEQTSVPFSDGTSIKYTIAKWYTPNGDSIDQEGFEPDIEASSSEIEDVQYNAEETQETLEPDTVSVNAKAVQIFLKYLGYAPDLLVDIKSYTFFIAFSSFGMILHVALKEFLQAYEIVFLPTLFLCRMSISPVFPSADRAVPTLPPLPPLSPEHSGRVAQPGGPVHHGWLLRLLRRGRRGPLLLLSLRLLRPPGSHVVLHHGRRPCADSGDHQGALLLLRIHGGGRCGIALTHSPRLPSHRGSGVSRLCGTHCSVHGECWWTCTC